MKVSDLPSRRTEAWKWSDLRAAMAGCDDMLTGSGPVTPAGPIAALASTLDGAASAPLTVATGTRRMLLDHLGSGDSSLQLRHARYSEIVIEPHGELTRVVLQGGEDRGTGVIVDEVAVTLHEGAAYRQFVLAEGARLVRIESSITMAGEGACADLHGVYLAGEERHIDLTSRIRHAAPGGVTRQIVRGAARKGGRGVFQGKFIVDRLAQKTDAEMTHNALLLEEGAEVFAKPELEIYADDVTCAHGNTSGQLNEDAVFYLRQRGIADAEARAMLTRAFLIDALPAWLDGPSRTQIEARIDNWLAYPR